jgi:hypothetical protein
MVGSARRFTAFVGYSSAEADSRTIEFFARLLQSVDIAPFLYDFQESVQLTDAIISHIRNHDCLVAIATRRDKLADGDGWTMPDWVQQEIAIARAHAKPTAIFFERGVSVGGLIANERRQVFNRDDLLSDIDKIVQFCFKLRQALEGYTDLARHAHAPIERDYFRIEDQITWDRVRVSTAQILGHATEEGCASLFHDLTLEDRTPGVSVIPVDLTVQLISGPPGTSLRHMRVFEFPHRFSWRIDFLPSVPPWDEVSYAFRTRRTDVQPFTFEEAQDRVHKGTYKYREPICEACDWNMLYPTRLFEYACRFPTGYKPKNITLQAVNINGRTVSAVETERASRGLRVTDILDDVNVRLTVPNPLVDHIYFVFYTPPAYETIKKAVDSPTSTAE